jgi:hypothetical protein
MFEHEISMTLGGRADFASRVQARAVMFGSVVAIAIFALMLAPGIAFGPWFGASAAWFYTWATIAWISGVLGGAIFAALAARPTMLRDALLNGIAAWATAVALLLVAYVVSIGVGLSSADGAKAIFEWPAVLVVLLAGMLAFAAALLGGWLGWLSESEAVAPASVPTPTSPPIAVTEPKAQPT